MDGDLLLIFGFILAIVTIVAVGVNRIVARNLDHKERMALRRSDASQSGDDKYRKLEERVRVLERIATDGNHALASQIEQLRDLQEIDTLGSKQESTQ